MTTNTKADIGQQRSFYSVRNRDGLIDELFLESTMTSAGAFESDALNDLQSFRMRTSKMELRRFNAQRAIMPATTSTAGASRETANVQANVIGASAYASV